MKPNVSNWAGKIKIRNGKTVKTTDFSGKGVFYSFLTFMVALMLFTVSGFNCQAQSSPCGAGTDFGYNFYLSGYYQNQVVSLHFIGGISGYNGNAPEWLYTALTPGNAPSSTVVIARVVSVNGVPQDGPSTFLSPNSTEFQTVVNEALIWGYMDQWYFGFNQQSELNSEQNSFQTIYQNEWQQQLGIDLASLVNVATIIGPITEDLSSVLNDSDAAAQAGDFVTLYQDISSGVSSLQSSAYGSNAQSIINVLENYNVVTSQNYTSAQLIVGMAKLNQSQLTQFESDLFTAAYPGNTLKPDAQQYITTFLQNAGASAEQLGVSATASGAEAFYDAYVLAEEPASAIDSAQAAVSQAGDYFADGLPALAAWSAASTVMQVYVTPQADVLQDMVSLQNSLTLNLVPELVSVGGGMSGNDGYVNFDDGVAFAADVEITSSFESSWCNFGAQEEGNQIIQSQLQQYITLGPAFATRATSIYNMLTTANSISQSLVNQSEESTVPTISGLSQPSGALGDEITISGADFCNAANVYFGNASAWCQVNSSTSISTVVPAGTGTVDIQVAGPGGVSQINANDKFTYGTVSQNQTIKIISLSGDLMFGTVEVGTTVTNAFTINNIGNATLTVSNISYPVGFSGNWSGTIPAGGSTNVPVSFSPTAAIDYGPNVTVSSDATSGNNTISATGTGTNVDNFSFGPLLIVSIGSTTATINAWVYPNGAPSIGINEVLGDSVNGSWSTLAGQTSPIFEQIKLFNLQSSAQYSFYLETVGGLMSQIVYFGTTPTGSAPTIQTEGYSPVDANSGEFNATIVPNGQPTTAWFNYTIGSAIFSSAMTNIPTSDSQLPIGPWIASNLPPATTIFWQVVASNLWGAISSPMQSFTTLPLPPSIVNLVITNVTSSSAAISVILGLNGGDSDFSIVVTNDATDSVTNTPFTDIGSESSPTNLTIQITGLSASNAYSACLIATNSGGSSLATFQFTTLSMQYAICASADYGGNIYPTNVTVTIGYDQTFIAATNINYIVNQWLLDSNIAQVGGNTFTLANVQTNHNVEVTFTYAPVYYAVNASAGNGGSVYPTSLTVVAGSNATFTATSNKGYAIDQWLTNGVPVQSGDADLTLTNVTVDVNVEVTFSVLPGGIISLNGDLAFGTVIIGQPVQNLLEIANAGNETLTVTNIVYPNSVFSGDWSGTIAPGSFHYVLVTFQPTVPGSYGGNVVVVSDAVIGTNSIPISGLGISTNPPPVLGVQMQNGSFILNWPTNAVGFTLESATNLGPPAIWNPVITVPAVVNGQNVLTNPISIQNEFFRLQL